MKHLALLALIANAEIDYGIPPNLLKAILTVESNLNPYAVVVKDGIGGRSSYGIGQVQLRTAKQFREGVSVKELYEPNVNIRISAAYLRWQFDRYGDWGRSIVAYNRGNSTGGTNEYYRKVMREYVRGKKSKRQLSRACSGRATRYKNCVIGVQQNYSDTAKYRPNLYAEERRSAIGEIP